MAYVVSNGDTVGFKLKIILALVVICMLLPLQAMADSLDYSQGFIPQSPDGFNTISGHDFDVSYGPASQGDICIVEDDASTSYAIVEDFFHDVPFHPDIIVSSSHEEYEDILNVEGLPNYSMSSGWGDGAKSAVVIKQPGLVPDFQIAMTHEMTHIATRSYIMGYKYSLPEWFSEGLAVYVSGDLSAAKRSAIDDLCRENRLMSIEELERVHKLSSTDEVTSEDVGTAYTQSGLLVEYIADKYGDDSLLQILDRFGPTGDLDEAFVAITGETPDQINADWQNGLKAELDRRDGKILEQTVYGYIADQHGSPMPNETVSFTVLRNDSPVEGTVYTTTTNESGQYSIKVTYGPLKVESEKTEYSGFNATITLARNQSMFLNVTLNGSALEARLAAEKAERERRNTIYEIAGGICVISIAAVAVVFVRQRKNKY